MYILRSSINYKIRNHLIPSELEAVCVEIRKPHSLAFLVTIIYRPPNSSHDFFENFEKLIKAIDDENKERYILGDLNCDMLKTESDTPTKKIKSLYELYQLLSQLIKEATRVTMATSSLIDHIVTNTPKKISDSGVIHTGISYHSLVFTIRKIHISKKQDENIAEIRNIKNFDDKNLLKICLIRLAFVNMASSDSCLGVTSIFIMLPQITSTRRYEGFYVNLSTLSHGNLTVDVQSNYHTVVQILYHKYIHT